MAITLIELSQKIGATLSRGDGGIVISGAASLADAGPNQLAAFTDPKYLPQLQKTRAAAILLKPDTENTIVVPANAAILSSPDPELAMLQAIRLLHPETRETPGIDSRAAIDSGAAVEPGAYVGPFAVIRAGAKIGARAVIHAHAVVGRNCVVGEECVIHPHAVLYDGVTLGARTIVHSGTVLGADGFGYKFRGGKHVKVPQIGTVEIGSDVEIGANTCIDRAALGATKVGSGTKIDNLVQVGHNVSIGNHCILCGQAAIAGSSGMDDYAVLGGNAGIADHVFMGKGSKAGAKSGVGKDVPPGAEVWGMFAVERKEAFRQLAGYQRLPELLERVKTLEKELAALTEKG